MQHQLKKQSIDEFTCNPVNQFDKKWALVTAGDASGVNTMTISWGAVGELWGKSVTFTFIRPQRYTKQFIDRQQTYSVCFFDEAYREELSYLGRVSGKDEDKIRNSGLTVAFVDGTPYFEQAQTVLICKKLYSQKLEKAAFLAPEIPQKVYAGDDYHTMYISEILSLYQAER